MPGSSGSPFSSASCQASTGERSAVTKTMTSGNSSRMPKTAMRMPTVRKILTQNSDIRFRTLALTTALSKESDTSSTIRIAVTATPVAPS